MSPRKPVLTRASSIARAQAAAAQADTIAESASAVAVVSPETPQAPAVEPLAPALVTEAAGIDADKPAPRRSRRPAKAATTPEIAPVAVAEAAAPASLTAPVEAAAETVVAADPVTTFELQPPPAPSSPKARPPRAPRAPRAAKASTAAPAEQPAIHAEDSAAVAAAAPVEATIAATEHSPAVVAAAESVAAVAPVADLPPVPPATHLVYPVALGRKRDALQHLLALDPERQTLVYTRTKHGADKISRFLERCSIKAAAVHGDKSQGARNRALAGFKNGELRVLVITDIAARGLDLANLPVVINYDLPHFPEDYVARISRLIADGPSLSIITQEESPQFREVRQRVGSGFDVHALAGFEPPEPFDPNKDPAPRPEAEAAVAAAAPAARPERPARTEAPERPKEARRERDAQAGRGRRERGPKPAREERQPFSPLPVAPPVSDLDEDDDDQPGHGNSLTVLTPSQSAEAARRRGRRGRSNPFAPVEVDESVTNIYDERQPDDYRDQWSILGPDTGRPAWTYADHHVAPPADPQRRAPAQPSAGPRRGPGGPGRGPQPQGRGPQAGPGRGPQPGAQRGPKKNSGRPRRAEGR